MQNKKAGDDPDAKKSGLFGEWQTVPFEPAIAENGKVPRNAFGNVDLYQECMLPIGCVWIRDLEAKLFSKVCRQLDVDCAKACTGFDGKKGYPVIDGYIICQEFEDAVKMAYDEIKEIEYQKNREKIRARAKKNWRHLVHVYFIQKKVRKLYGDKGCDPAFERIISQSSQSQSQRSFEENLDTTDIDALMRKELEMHPGPSSKKKSIKSQPLSSFRSYRGGGKSGVPASSKGTRSKYFLKTESDESEPEDTAEDIEMSESKISEDSSGDDEKKLKRLKKENVSKEPQRTSARQRRQSKPTKSKYVMSSDSSDFSSESDGEWA